MSGLRGSSVERPSVTLNTEEAAPDLRAKLYQNYASLMEAGAGPKGGEAVRRAGRLFSYHFCGWLPVDRAPSVLDAASSVKPV